jgi:hypothetical protein
MAYSIYFSRADHLKPAISVVLGAIALKTITA